MEFSRQAYWSRWPFLPLGDLPDPGIDPRSPAMQVNSLPSEPPGKPTSKNVTKATELRLSSKVGVDLFGDER